MVLESSLYVSCKRSKALAAPVWSSSLGKYCLWIVRLEMKPIGRKRDEYMVRWLQIWVFILIVRDLNSTAMMQYLCLRPIPSVVSLSTRLSRSPHSVFSLFISLNALTGCPRKPSGSCVAAADNESSLSAHLKDRVGDHQGATVTMLKAPYRPYFKNGIIHGSGVTLSRVPLRKWSVNVGQYDSLFQTLQFVLLCFDVVFERSNKVLLCVQQVCHLTWEEKKANNSNRQWQATISLSQVTPKLLRGTVSD